MVQPCTCVRRASRPVLASRGIACRGALWPLFPRDPRAERVWAMEDGKQNRKSLRRKCLSCYQPLSCYFSPRTSSVLRLVYCCRARPVPIGSQRTERRQTAEKSRMTRSTQGSDGGLLQRSVTTKGC